MPDDRETPEQRYLGGGHILSRDDDSSDDDRAAIRNQNLRFFGLRVQCRNALDARNALVDLRILDQHVHEHRAFLGDLRGHFQFQHRVDELDGNRVIDRRLDRDFLTLFNDCLFVVLRHHARLGE